MTSPVAEPARGLSDVTGESAGQSSMEQLLESLRSAPAARRASLRRLPYPTNADGSVGERQAPKAAVSPEAKDR
jgi:hypothetical protein